MDAVAEMDTLARFLPMDRRQALAAGRTLPAQAAGAVLFVDLAGYTALGTVFAAADPQAAGEALRQALDPVFAALITAVHAYRGSILGFAGDSFTAWFPAPAAPRRAVTAASAIQVAMREAAPVALPDGTSYCLTLKCAVTSGHARRFLAGDPAYGCIDVLAGPPLFRAGQAEHLAAPGEIILDEPTATTLSDATGSWRRDPQDGTRFFSLTVPPAPAHPRPWPTLPATAIAHADLLAWLPAALRPRILADPSFLPELRPAVALFLRFSGLDYASATAAASLDTYLRAVQATLAHFGGTLIQLTLGDKGSYLYAGFGVPVAHGDAAARAAAAALVLRTPPATCPFITSVQIGLAAGPVYAGPYGSAASYTYGAIGPAVNRAARLMQAAAPGNILASAAVRRAAAGFTWTTSPPLTLKGEPDPVPVYELAGRSSLAAQPAAEVALVGRVTEQATLRGVLARAAAGQGQVVGVSGEAGLGKSRLTAEVVREAAAAGWAVYRGAAPSYGRESPYLAWQPLWQSFFALDPADPPAAQTATLSAQLAALDVALLPRLPLLGAVLGPALPDTDLTAGMEPKQRQESLVGLLIAVLRARAAMGPLLLVLEDAHWLDPLSADLLEVLGRAISDHSVVLLVNYRPLEEEQAASLGIVQLPHFTAITLAGLPEVEAAALATARLTAGGGNMPHPDLITALVERAGGNPFYLEELVAYGREQGVDLSDPAALARIQWPDSLRSLLLARIDQLRETQRTVLKVASVVGMHFPVPHLWGVHPDLGPVTQVQEDLLDLAYVGLTPLQSLEPEFVHRFNHALTHEVTYGTLPTAVRAGLHEQFAAWLEGSRGPAGEAAPLELLAYHYGRSANRAKQGEYFRKAGDAAAAVYANALAVEYYERLLAVLPVAEQGSVFLKLGQLLELSSAFAAAADRYRAAWEWAQERDDPLLMARAAHGLGVVCREQGLYVEASSWLNVAHQGLADLGERSDVSRVLLDLSQLYEHQGDLPGAHAQGEAGLALCRAASDTVGVASALIRLGRLGWRQGTLPTAQILVEESVALYRTLNDKWGLATALNTLATIFIGLGNQAAAWRVCEEGLQLRQEIGDRKGIAQSLLSEGVIMMEQGDYEAARPYMMESLALARDLGHQLTEGFCLNNLGLIDVDQGDYPAARAWYKQGLEICGELGHKALLVDLLIGQAAVLSAEGQTECAGRLLGALAREQAEIGLVVEPPEQRLYDQTHEAVRVALGEAEFQAAWAAGQSLTWESAVSEALSLD